MQTARNVRDAVFVLGFPEARCGRKLHEANTQNALLSQRHLPARFIMKSLLRFRQLQPA
jgi:hypothetical protein